MATIKTGRMPLEDIRKLLEMGLAYRKIAGICGYPISSISTMAKCWNIDRPMGRRKATE
jgi:hypothetical protein